MANDTSSYSGAITGINELFWVLGGLVVAILALIGVGWLIKTIRDNAQQGK